MIQNKRLGEEIIIVGVRGDNNNNHDGDILAAREEIISWCE